MGVRRISPFLLIPLELRVEVYKLVELSGSITIGSERSGLPSDHLIPGLPSDHVPVVRTRFDKKLLLHSYTNKSDIFDINNELEISTISANTVCPSDSVHAASFTASEFHELIDPICSLRLTCRQIASELALPGRSPLSASKAAGSLDLYLSFPTGVCTAIHKYPNLLRQARNIKIAGPHYFHQADCEKMQRAKGIKAHSWMDLDRLDKESENDDAQTTDEERSLDPAMRLVLEQNQALKTLVWMLLGHTTANSKDETTTASIRTIAKHKPHAPSRLNKLHVRIFFPCNAPHSPYETYRAIWELQESPIPLVLAAICGGDIVLACARGREAVGVEIIAKDNGGKSRCVTGVWPSLDRNATEWWADELEVGKEGLNYSRVKGVDD